MSYKRKLQLMVDERAYETLVRLGDDSDASSLAEVIRNAISLLDWANQQVKDGFAVGAFRDGTPVKEVVLSCLHRSTEKSKL